MHFGVKGMRWGVRNKKENKDNNKMNDTKKKVIIGSAVLLGATVTALLLKKHHDLNIKDLRIRNDILDEKNRILNEHRLKKFSDLRKDVSLSAVDINDPGKLTKADRLAKLIQRDYINQLGRSSRKLNLDPKEFGIKAVRKTDRGHEIFRDFGKN